MALQSLCADLDNLDPRAHLVYSSQDEDDDDKGAITQDDDDDDVKGAGCNARIF